jgi:thioredoxin-like negative regulator of GroEL
VAEPIDLDATSFSAEVLDHDGAVLVDFWSPTCPHCRKLAPDFAAAAVQCGERAKFAKVSVQDARPLFSEHGITAVPTLILFDCGKKVAQREGALSPEQIIAWIEEAVAGEG